MPPTRQSMQTSGSAAKARQVVSFLTTLMTSLAGPSSLVGRGVQRLAMHEDADGSGH